MITLNQAQREIDALRQYALKMSPLRLRDIHFKLHRAWGEGDYIPPTDENLSQLAITLEHIEQLWPTTPATV